MGFMWYNIYKYIMQYVEVVDMNLKKCMSLLLTFTIMLSFVACGTVVPNAQPENSSPVNTYAATTPSQNDIMTPGDTSFAVHFIDVGQGDAALVLCDGKSMLIDGGKPNASDVVYTYLQKQGITCLDYIICSHPDDDHIGGLSAPLSTITVRNVYAPDVEDDTQSYQSFKQKTKEQGLTIQNPVCGDSLQFGSSKVDFLGPITESDNDKNNSSIVMKITYGETSFLFTGDAEREEEAEILEQGYDLSATVLKVSHHGSAGATTYPWLREIMPQYAVISVGKDNSYGHPTEETLSKLRDADVRVFRTDQQGDIIAISDGKNVTITPTRNADIDTLTIQKLIDNMVSNLPQNVPEGYIGNISTKKFHRPTCSSLPAKYNRIVLASRNEAIEKGYTPCKRCEP